MNLRTAKTTRSSVVLTSLSEDHPLRSRLSAASLARLASDGLPAEAATRAGASEPTALVYQGEAYTTRGAGWRP